MFKFKLGILLLIFSVFNLAGMYKNSTQNYRNENFTQYQTAYYIQDYFPQVYYPQNYVWPASR